MEAELPNVTFGDLLAFQKSLWDGVSMEVLSHGNITQKMTLEYVEKFIQILGLKFVEKPAPPPSSMLRGKDQTHVVYALRSQNPDEVNSCVHTSFELDTEKDLRLLAILRLYASMINAPAFAYLRTQKQLGYLVFTMYETYCGCLRFVFIIQSSEFSPNAMDTEIELFLNQFHKSVAETSEKELEAKKQALALDITKRIKTLNEQRDIFWTEIRHSRFEFDIRDRLADVVKTITKQDLMNFVNTYMDAKAPTRTKLSLWQYGKSHQTEKVENCFWIDNEPQFQNWRKNLPKYKFPYPRASAIADARL